MVVAQVKQNHAENRWQNDQPIILNAEIDGLPTVYQNSINVH